VEQVDVVVVGARLAGCALAAPLARSGRKVVVLDKMSFPSDQLSTHVLTPGGTSELAKLGALPRILALNPSKVRWTTIVAEGIVCTERLRPAADGIDFGLCVPRDLQDICLVEAVRDQGGDVRERSTFSSVHWRAGRVAGVRYTDEHGDSHYISARLVVGADGRRSNVAAAVGAWSPYRVSRNGRGLVFRYLDDPQAGTRAAETYMQWRDGDSIAFAFPTAPEGRLLILFMGDRDEVGDARSDPARYWLRKVTEHPALAERLAGLDESSCTKLRSTGETPAFFRASSGPGWALAGDAGHFKDPVTGQGMRDALWMGRTLAEHVLPVLDDPAGLDRAMRLWEAERDRDCLHAYHFANLDTRVERPSPGLCELVRDAGRNTEPDLTDLFGRARTFYEIAPPARLARVLFAALWRGERSRRETLRYAARDIRTDFEMRREQVADRFRSIRLVTGSDHPGAAWPAPPLPEAGARRTPDAPHSADQEVAA
jgi:menaquinone-9 beta-reductase